MAGDDDILEQFKAAIAGAELDELRGLTPQLLRAADGHAPQSGLRKKRRTEPALYRVTVDLNDAEPRIWRTLELRSDLGLDLVHEVLQGAFAWTDSHLHQFAIGAGPFDREGQIFLCPFDVEEGEAEGIPASEVRLDETMRDPGDVLHYVYDFGDNWDVTLRLDAVLPLPADAEPARCVDGRRAAPPEDCGGRRRAEELAEVLEDPEHFDLDEINRTLLDPLLLMHQAGVSPDLLAVLRRLRFMPVTGPLMTLGLELCEQGPPLSQEDFDDLLRPVLWFLERAQGEGLPLTSAGYLKPGDVEEASRVVPAAKHWIGRKNRETQTAPVLWFREMLQSLGLLRKYRGRLLLTKAGARGLAEPDHLWGHIASRLIPRTPRFDREASLLTLLWGTSLPDSVPGNIVIEAVAALGWKRNDGTPVSPGDLRHETTASDVLAQLAPERWPSRDLFTRCPATRA
ncbi:MAG TPA: plasmid pRiA4b ORF-3 family protein, partial [Actinomycetota bacterium]|nr:plasmid pRiA4b ORF-3 family protein [Actinomycetota bacterium]